MRNTLEKAGMAISSLAVVGTIGYKTPGWLDEQAALNHLQTMDFAEEHMKGEQFNLKAKLDKEKPAQAQAISAQCTVALNNCLDSVEMPKAEVCAPFGADAKVFHELTAKPRESHLLSTKPEIYRCDLIIQEAINKCHQDTMYCLDKPLR